MTKRTQDATYVFAVCMRNHSTTATFTCKQTTLAKAEVLGEDQALTLNDGVFTDEFAPYAVHLCRLKLDAMTCRTSALNTTPVPLRSTGEVDAQRSARRSYNSLQALDRECIFIVDT
jgi:hypothetical protein